MNGRIGRNRRLGRAGGGILNFHPQGMTARGAIIFKGQRQGILFPRGAAQGPHLDHGNFQQRFPMGANIGPGGQDHIATPWADCCFRAAVIDGLSVTRVFG